MPRAQSSHAIVNLGFLVKLDDSNVVKEVNIRYGALSASFDRAVATERYMLDKPMFTNDTLQGALRVLESEMIVEDHPPEPSVEYRRYIAKALLYKVSDLMFIYYAIVMIPLCYHFILFLFSYLFHEQATVTGRRVIFYDNEDNITLWMNETFCIPL